MLGNLPVIQSLWIGDRLSIMEQLCLASFLYHGHPFHLYVYDEIKNVPPGATLKDASQLIPPDKIFKYKHHDSYAGFSNIFRYKLILEKGSYWVDTDMICLKPFLSTSDYVFSSERVWRGSTHVNSGVIKAPSGCEIMQYCYDKSNCYDLETLVWGEIGPKLIASAVKFFHLQGYVASPETFCPVNVWHWERVIKKSFLVNYLESRKIYKAQAVHLWNEMWRRNNINKDDTFSYNTIYEQFKRRYL